MAARNALAGYISWLGKEILWCSIEVGRIGSCSSYIILHCSVPATLYPIPYHFVASSI